MINGFSILNSAKYFSKEDGLQNYLVFQPVIKYFKPLTNDIVRAWKSKGFSAEIIKPPTTSDNNLNPRLDYFNNLKFQVEFNGSYLKSDSVGFAPNKKINVYITYEIKS